MSIYRHFTVDEALSLVLTASEDQYLAPSAESQSNADTSASDDDSDGEEIRVSRSAVPLSAAVVGVSTSLHGDVPDGSEPCDAPGPPSEDDGDERSLQYWEGDVDTDTAVHEFVLNVAVAFSVQENQEPAGEQAAAAAPMQQVGGAAEGQAAAAAQVHVADAGEGQAADAAAAAAADTPTRSCGCTKNCLSKFPSSEVGDFQLTMRGLEKAEKDMLLMGVLLSAEYPRSDA